MRLPRGDGGTERRGRSRTAEGASERRGPSRSVRVGQDEHRAARLAADEGIEIEPAHERSGGVRVKREHGNGARQRPLRELGGVRERLGITPVGIEQQGDQPPTPTLTLARLVRLPPHVPLDDVGRELVGKHEDRLGERDHGLGRHPGLGGEVGRAPPGRPGTRPPRRPQRLEVAAGLELGLAEPPPHLGGLAARAIPALDRVEKRPDRLLDPEPDSNALRSLEHVGVHRVLRADL